METHTLEIDFYGVRVALLSDAPELLADLGRDFAWFSAGTVPLPAAPGAYGPTGAAGTVPLPGRGPHIRLTLSLGAPAPGRLPRRAYFRWKGARIAQEGTLRKVDYGGRALLEYDLDREEGSLRGESPELLHELAYLAVLSRAGELLDRGGLHRVHALGFTYRGRGGLVLLRMGGGKSRLALELLKREGFGLLSDDMPLLEGNGRRLRAFPLRLGLRGGDRDGIPEGRLRPFHRRRFGTKFLVDLDYFRGKVCAAAPLCWVLTASRGAAERPRIAPCSGAGAAGALLSGMVAGIGLPQVLELMLPAPPFLSGAPGLASIAAGRLSAAARALSGARCGRFRLASDAAANADALEGFLAG